MRRPALILIAPLALGLSACADAGDTDPGAESAGPEAAASDEASPAPNATLTSPATPGAMATPAATAAAQRREVDDNPPGDECGASQVAPFVAQAATPAVRAQVVAKVGHNRIRWIGPDTVVTMDYSAERLNVNLDGNNVITGGRCG